MTYDVSMKNSFLSILGFGLLILMASCSKEEDDDTIQGMMESESWVQEMDQSTEDIADEWVLRSDSDEVDMPNCVVITDSGADVYPRLISLDFGDGCTDSQGRTRTGIMHIAISAPWTEVGSVREVTFEDFTFTRPMQDLAVGIEGVRTLERLEPGDSGESRWSREVNTTLLLEGGDLEHAFSGIRRWISGENNPDADQIFGWTGFGSHTRNGGVRHRNILEEVWVNRTCGEAVQGLVEVERPVLDNFTIDYGAGECDGIGTISSGGASFIIDL